MTSSVPSKHFDRVLNFTSTIRSDTYAFINPRQFNLAGRSVLITGASKGIGRQAASSFARAGASQIILAARSSLTEVAAETKAAAIAAGHPSPDVLSITLDVADEASVAAAAEQVSAATGGQLDILINNAGAITPFVPLASSEPTSWWRIMEVNLKGPYLVARAFIPLLLSSTKSLKTILNVSSIGAHAVMPGASSYQTTKLALLRLTEFICTDYVDQKLIALAIHPGAIMTEVAAVLPEAFHPTLTDTPALAADAMVWLTAERREWLAGRYVSCTWDMEQLEEKREEIVERDLLKVRMDVGVV